MTFRKVVVVLFACLLSMSALFSQPRNILWDGGFDTGFGNSFWATIRGNYGPSFRDMWSDGAVRLKRPIATRVYWLEEGTYSFCAWVRRAQGHENEATSVTLLLTNRNYYKDKKRNQYRKRFEIPAGNEWTRVGWYFEIQAPYRNYFHVEIWGGKGIYDGDSVLVDAVSLTPGEKMPDRMLPAAQVLAGFYIPEETGIYVDGEKRVVQLRVRNSGPAGNADVKWRIYDHREDLVRKGAIQEELPAGKTIVRNIPMDDLPYNGYRLACAVEGETVLGDALVAILPKVSQDAFPEWGADATIGENGGRFTGRFMQRLGMKLANTLSCAGRIGRWPAVSPELGKHVWHDKPVNTALEYGLEISGFLGLKYPPQWVRAKYMSGKWEIKDPEGFAAAFADHVAAFADHYAGRIKSLHLEDEIHGHFRTPEKMKHLALIFKKAYHAAKKAAAAKGEKILVGINATSPKFWDRFIDVLGKDYIDFVSQNTNLRPHRTADTLNIMRKKGVFPEYFYTIGVGQKSQLRRTSLILDMASTTSHPPGLFAWQAMLHAWLSRPYGTEDVRHGPLIRYGYYDLRLLGQSIYLPHAAKTGIEYDNSPTLGMQAITMMKHMISGMRPARDPEKDFTTRGEPTASGRIFAYPFRNRQDAVIALMTVDGRELDRTWKLSGGDFRAWRPVDMFDRPLQISDDGSLLTRDLPVYLRVKAAELDRTLSAIRKVKAEPVPNPSLHTLRVADYILDIDPARDSLLQLRVKKGEKEIVMIDGIQGWPQLGKPTIQLHYGRLVQRANLRFSRQLALGLILSKHGLRMGWSHSNNLRKEPKQTVRFRIGDEGAGREIVVQEDNLTSAGKLREDYGRLFPAQFVPKVSPIPPHSSKVSIKGFAAFEMSAAYGQGGFSPETGFLFKLRDGEAFLEAQYKVAPYPGGGTRGLQKIFLDIIVRAQ